MDGLYSPSWALNELRRSSSAVSEPGKLCVGKQDNNHRKNSFENPNFDDGFSFVKLLKECAKKKDVCKGVRLHAYITQGGILEKNPYIASSLINMYAKCGMLSKAREVHDELRVRKLDSWNALIGGLAQQGQGQEALNCFEHMKCEGLSPDFITYISILKASGVIECLSMGQQIHEEIVGRSLLGRSVLLGTTLVGMYAKCGEHDKAYQVLEELPIRNVFSWNALIGGCADQGLYRLAAKYLEDMEQRGLKPNCRTYTSIIVACSHAGQVDEGRRHFYNMIEIHGITPDLEHFNCLIDLLGRAGRLHEADELLQTTPNFPGICGWRSLLNSCRIHGDIDLGEECYGQAVYLYPEDASGYMLMSNMHADACNWDDMHVTQELRKNAAAWKKPGSSWIELRDEIYEFVVGGSVCSQSETKLHNLNREIRSLGFIPQVEAILVCREDI